MEQAADVCSKEFLSLTENKRMRRRAMADITKDMKISEILALNELMAPFRMQNGMACVTLRRNL